ncbi:MAG: cation:proton antiporter [Bacteroidetes bacterium]|nr:cation:proton antiporter [Bacteroidota bacterium]MBS1610746.1 cation:proton antiporter [Bacteroidota bacterium]
MIFLKITFPLQDPVPIFTIVLFIILLAPIILRKLRIPSIVGLIIAGMAVGDHGFNLVAKGSIDLFGKAGLLYIMFLAGLELDMAEFKKNTYKSIVFGILTFSIPLSLGFLLCSKFLHFNFTASLLVSSMFATHTLVAYPLASRMGISKNEAVTIAVGGTIITDIAVLLMLPVIVGSIKGGLTQEFWIRLSISFLLFALIILFGFPPIGRWFFKRIKDDQTTHFVFVLAMVFLAAFLAEMAGIEGIIGAFLAGLALNQLIPRTSPLMNRIEFTGNAIFIPFFLISVGMLIDLRVLLKGQTALVIAGLLTTMALVSKWTAAFITQLIFRYTATQRNVIFGLSSAHAAATIAVILIGFNLGVVDENVLNGTIILILITCLTGSFVTANAGKRLAVTESAKLPEVTNLYERILISVINPERNEQLLDFAIMLQEQREKSPVYLLNVVQDNDEVKEQVLMTNQNMEKVIRHAAETDTNIQVLTRVDLNMTSGISRAVKEMLISDVIIDWDEKNTGTTDFLFNSLFGSATDNILDSVWETVYVCRFMHPVNAGKRIVLITAKNAEYEIGFSYSVRKISTLSRQLGIPIISYAYEKTQSAFEKEIKKLRSQPDIKYKSLKDGDIETVLKSISGDDLITIISARKATISYNSQFENIHNRIAKQFPDNNFLLIYPEQTQVDFIESGMQSQDINLSPIQEQIDNLNKLGKAVKRIFRPSKPGETNRNSGG